MIERSIPLALKQAKLSNVKLPAKSTTLAGMQITMKMDIKISISL